MATPELSGEALVWPMPVADADILWLEAEEATSAPPVDNPPDRPAPAAPVARRESTGVSLAQLINGNVSMEWHDAVAVVSQLAAQMLNGNGRLPTGALPSIGAIRLESDGQLHVQLVPNSPESLAEGFGRVLQALLQDKPTPANLRLLAWRTTSGAGGALTLDEITGELARWERPGRIRKLIDLYERARAAGPAPIAVSLPVVPLEVPVAVVAPEPAAASEPKPAGPARSRRQIVAIVAAALVCVAIGGTGAWLLDGPRDTPTANVGAPSVSREAVAAPEAKVRPGRRSTRATPQTPVRAGSLRADGNSGPRQSLRQSPAAIATAAAATSAAQGRPSAAQAESDRSFNSPPLDNSIANLAAPTAVPPQVVSTIGDRRLYTSADAGVTEAILVKPYLPLRAHPDIPDTALGVLEVVVDARGLVESVHLKSPANRYREKWWLFTAKDWRFEPARKNGTPVRSLKRILLTDLNIAEPQ